MNACLPCAQGTQVDDGETVAGLIAALVVLSLVLIVVVAVFFALCTIYIIRRRKGEC